MKPVLVIGGTGTIGRVITKLLLYARDQLRITRIRVLSRNEHDQTDFERLLPAGSPVDFFLGDIRDARRIVKASRGCKAVFHFAATKSVDKVEYDPEYAVENNIRGTENVIHACLVNRVKRAIFTSTDKAVNPITFYGATKLCAERLWIAGNRGTHSTKFSAVRYGNVWGSRGSIGWLWAKGPPYFVTDPGMTRFFIKVEDAAKLIMIAYSQMNGGEIYIPKMKATTLRELVDAFGKKATEIGRRPGEKIHEMIISPDERHLITEYEGMFIRWPEYSLFPTTKVGDHVDLSEEGYMSKNAKRFTKKELEELWRSLSVLRPDQPMQV